jgi:hypothetical protein
VALRKSGGHKKKKRKEKEKKKGKKKKNQICIFVSFRKFYRIGDTGLKVRNKIAVVLRKSGERVATAIHALHHIIIVPILRTYF